MQVRPDVADEPEVISLIDIYDFIRDGFNTLLGLSVLGLLVGLVVSLLLPVKYEASGLIESGKIGYVSSEGGVGSREAETLNVLAEKMKAPGFYADKTIVACGLADKLNPRQKLVRDLNPSVARNSSFVSVSYQAESVDKTKRCIESVLTDVVTSQREIINSVVGYTQIEIANTQKQLEEAQSLRNQQRVDREEGLNAVRELIAVARQELKVLDELPGQGDASVGSVAAVRAMNKQGEVQALESYLVALQSELNSNVSELVEQINRLSNRLTALKASIEFPNTRDPQFATPVFVSDSNVSPSSGLVGFIGVLVGAFVGLMILLIRRAIKYIRAHQEMRGLE